ncbi:MAG: response regulator transcription factor [Bacteroidales bacterium]|nr:response regulator transcription factor [Bacteroidales bacterium]
MRSNSKKALFIIPSIILARGLESILSDMGEFETMGILTDLSRSSETRLRNMDADIIIIDPIVFDYESRANIRSILAEHSSAAVIAFTSYPLSDEAMKQFDDVIGPFDEPAAIIKKMRAALEPRQDASKTEGEELSQREKEILVCVAKGMLNKEIADAFNISIYTVITHRKNITRKTGIKTVAGLTVYALLNNLIDLNAFE